MLKALGYSTLDEFIDATIPETIRAKRPLGIGKPRTEHDVLNEIRRIAGKNKVFRSYLGLGYHDTLVPPVIQRNILENPGWYTAYTPYQSEIAQGRLEALLNYQTVVIDLTGLPIANASMLDEGTAAAEAMHLAYGVKGKEGKETVFIDKSCHPQTIDIVKTRAWASGLKVVIGDAQDEEVQQVDVRGHRAVPDDRWRGASTGATSPIAPTRWTRSWSRPATCSRSRCWRLRANGALTWWSATRSASACR